MSNLRRAYYSPTAADFDLPMVSIPAGTFLMGSPDDELYRHDDEGPQHQVTLKAFQMSQTPITQAQWQAVMGNNPSYLRGEQRPVDNVSCHDAMEFCAKLSEITGEKNTLPSEAQWEYACRAATTTPYYFGETITPEFVNYNGLAYRIQGETTPVGMFPANAWGLQDMHGNVWEWCLDDWHANYEGAPTDGSARVEGEGLGKSCAAATGSTTPGTAARPAATTSGPSLPTTSLGSASAAGKSNKLLRGGSWYSFPWYCRSATRNHFQLDVAGYCVGFRVVCLP